MGTKCCWQENEDNPEHKSANENNSYKAKEVRKADNNENVNLKRKSYPLQNKNNKFKELKRIQDLKLKEDIDTQEKRSSTASFHSASSLDDRTNTSFTFNNDSFDTKYQG